MNFFTLHVSRRRGMLLHYRINNKAGRISDTDGIRLSWQESPKTNFTFDDIQNGQESGEIVRILGDAGVRFVKAVIEIFGREVEYLTIVSAWQFMVKLSPYQDHQGYNEKMLSVLQPVLEKTGKIKLEKRCRVGTVCC